MPLRTTFVSSVSTVTSAVLTILVFFTGTPVAVPPNNSLPAPGFSAYNARQLAFAFLGGPGRFSYRNRIRMSLGRSEFFLNGL